MRLIDADALIESIEQCRSKHSIFAQFARAYAKDAPTIDAVLVVRCKDCRWGRETCGNIECFADSNIPTEYHGYEWFCPNGERKDND